MSTVPEPPGLYGVPPPLVLTPPPRPPAPAESFSVDLARAPQVLRDLEDARRQLLELCTDAEQLGRVDPGSNDEVSRDAAAIIGAVAVGGPGNLLDALNGGIAHLDGLIDSLRAELRAYRDSDASVGDRRDVRP